MSNSVSGGQCHLTHLTIIRRFSWPNLACMCKSGLKPDSFHFSSESAFSRVMPQAEQNNDGQINLVFQLPHFFKKFYVI